jgi:hypothetical protein
MTGEQQKQEKQYKSPQSKLVKFFEKSRDAWKRKCLEAKRTVKRLKNRSRFLEQRKEQWKKRAQELEAELNRINERKECLEEEVERLKKKQRSMSRM